MSVKKIYIKILLEDDVSIVLHFPCKIIKSNWIKKIKNIKEIIYFKNNFMVNLYIFFWIIKNHNKYTYILEGKKKK